MGVLKDELSYFVNCVLSQRQPTVITSEESREAVRVMVATEESAKSGKVVDL
jgi:predicted dehydrogenase